MKMVYLLFIFGILGIFFLSNNVYAQYSNNATGRLNWLEDAINYESNVTPIIKSPDINISNFDINTDGWTILSGGLGGENVTRITNGCIRGSGCLNFTYNMSGQTIRAVQKFNMIINMSNYTGIGFWYKGDGSNNILAVRNRLSDAASDNVNFISFSLNSTEWKYGYMDFNLFRNLSNGNLVIERNRIDSYNLTTLYLRIENNSNTVYSSVFFDDVQILDYNKGDVHRNYNKSTFQRNARYVEGMYNLAYQYNYGNLQFKGNELLLNKSIDMGDYLVIQQLPDGAWTENFGENNGGTDATVGFTGYAFIKTYLLIKNSSKMNENITIYHQGNLTTNTRGYLWNDTLQRMANWSLNTNFPRTGHWFSNQYFARQNTLWIYYNHFGGSYYIDKINSELIIMNNTWQLNRFGFLPENNISNSIGIDVGYLTVGTESLFQFYNDAKLPILIEIMNKSDYAILNLFGRNESYTAYLYNGSRGSNYNDGITRSFIYNNSKNFGFIYTQEINYGGFNNWSTYGDINKIAPYRSTAIYLEDFINFQDNIISNGLIFPQNYSKYSYDLLNETSWNIRILNESTNINTISKLQFPLMLFAYNSNDSWWVRGDYITGNNTNWIYSDNNGNFTIPIIPRVRYYSNDIQLAESDSQRIGFNVSINRSNFAFISGNNKVIINPQTLTTLNAFGYTTNPILSNGTLISGTILKNDQSNLTIPAGGQIYVA